MKDYYYCENCKKVLNDDQVGGSIKKSIALNYEIPSLDCIDCETEVIEQYECPIHGIDAPDGAGNCAKC